MSSGSTWLRVLPVPGVPTTQTLRLRSVSRSNPSRETGMPTCLVRGMLREGSSRFMKASPSARLPQRAEPCSSPRRSVPPRRAWCNQMPHTAHAHRMPASGASAFAVRTPPSAIHPGIPASAAIGSSEPSGSARRLPVKRKPAMAAKAEARAIFATVFLSKGVNGPSPGR